MHRKTLSVASALALMVGTSGQVEAPPPARDKKPARRQRMLYGGSAIPHEGLTHVSRETLNGQGYKRWAWERERKRERRRALMRLRKRRGWR